MTQPCPDTTYSPEDAARMARMGLGVVRTDTKLARGQWYHRHDPKTINTMNSKSLSRYIGQR